MEIAFEDKSLALIETDRAADTKLPVSVIHSARQRLGLIRAAPDLRSMKNWKSLGLKAGPAAGAHVVTVTPQWSMGLRMETGELAMKVVITGMIEQAQATA